MLKITLKGNLERVNYVRFLIPIFWWNFDISRGVGMSKAKFQSHVITRHVLKWGEACVLRPLPETKRRRSILLYWEIQWSTVAQRFGQEYFGNTYELIKDYFMHKPITCIRNVLNCRCKGFQAIRSWAIAYGKTKRFDSTNRKPSSVVKTDQMCGCKKLRKISLYPWVWDFLRTSCLVRFNYRWRFPLVKSKRLVLIWTIDHDVMGRES